MLTQVHAYLRGEPRLVSEEFDDYFEPSRTAVVSIDMHRSHLEHPVACPCPGPRGIEAIELTDRFHRQARAAGVPIIHVRTYLRQGGTDDARGALAAWRRILRWSGEAGPLLDEHVIEGTRWTEFVTEVLPDDLVVHKKRLSSFFATDLDFLLRNMRLTTVVIDGIFIDACDLSTGFDAANLDYQVIVPRDVVRGSSEAMERAAFDIFSSYVGLVVESEDLVAEWNARRAAPDAEARDLIAGESGRGGR
jgi:nicotinamidase-related amidase